ncbi:golgin subfamily A member 6-like protein 24 [Macrobrachium nipponense]|uniref:golgin subfamily A member 6-like protein 24 n=1 Tax=Macrobrachium nipponense TaxID=159736 RepID=UPI0030C8B250
MKSLANNVVKNFMALVLSVGPVVTNACNHIGIQFAGLCSAIIKSVSRTDFKEEAVASFRDELALKEREITEAKRALKEESRKNKILRSVIEILRARASKREEEDMKRHQTQQESESKRKITAYTDLEKDIQILKEGQEALQNKMEQLVSLMRREEERPLDQQIHINQNMKTPKGWPTEAKREKHWEEENVHLHELMAESDSSYCLLVKKDSHRHSNDCDSSWCVVCELEDRMKVDEAEAWNMSGKRKHRRKRKEPIAWRFRAKRWNLNETASGLKFIAHIGKVRKAQKNKSETKRHLNYYEDHADTQALREELARQNSELDYMEDLLNIGKSKYQRLEKRLDSQKEHNRLLLDENAKMRGNLEKLCEIERELRIRLEEANCSLEQRDKEIAHMKRKMDEVNLAFASKSKIHDEQGNALFQCQRGKAKLEEQVQRLCKEIEKMRQEEHSRLCELQKKDNQLDLMEQMLKEKEAELKMKLDEDPEIWGLVDSLEGQLRRIKRERNHLADQLENLILVCRHQKMGLIKYDKVIRLLMDWREGIKQGLQERDFDMVIANYQ